MAGRNRPMDEYTIIADLMRQARRHGSALNVQLPVPKKDPFTVASTPATTYQLSYLPITPSINLSLNGQELLEGTDYTVDYTTGIVTVSATLKSTPPPADVLTADYWTTGDLIAASGPVDTGKLSIPLGATWKYQTGLANTPATYAAVGFDDSAWASGITPFFTGSYNDGRPGTLLTPDPVNFWMRTHGFTDGGNLRFDANMAGGGIDATVTIYIDGALVITWNFTGGASPTSTVSGIAGGDHVFAAYATDDLTEIVGFSVTEL